MYEAQKLEKLFEPQIKDLQESINELEEQKKLLNDRIAAIDYESIYSSDWGPPVEILARTEKQVQVKQDDKVVVLNRNKLETKEGHRNHRIGTEIMRVFLEKRAEIEFNLRRLEKQLIKIGSK